jgi:hypothetical protein
MNTNTSSWTRRIAAGAVLAAAPALIALGVPAASHADTNPGMGCETIHWGFLGSDRRQICDGPKQADGTWQRTRTIFTPAYVKPFSCTSSPDWSLGHFSPAPGPSPDPDPSPEPDVGSDSGFSSLASRSSDTGFSSLSSRSSFSSSLRCTGGYPVPQSTQSQESYVVAPNTVLPDEPGWLPPGTNNIL